MRPLIIFAFGAVFGATALWLSLPRIANLDLLGQANRVLSLPAVTEQSPPEHLPAPIENPILAQWSTAAAAELAAADATPVPDDLQPAPAPPPADDLPELDLPQPAPALPTAAPFATDMPTVVLPPAPFLNMPVMGAVVAQLHDEFTDPRSEGRGHEAIDIAAPLGTPVLAVAAGRVAKLFDSKRGGLTIYQFDVDENLAYYYAHLDHYAAGLTEGQQLARGEVIGYVGHTGNASALAPHLHFAIFVLGPEKQWWKGTAINPYPRLGGR
jgi:peptidoglycan LD-endopeptidase LytH